jgi:hypothetical protein
LVSRGRWQKLRTSSHFKSKLDAPVQHARRGNCAVEKKKKKKEALLRAVMYD